MTREEFDRKMFHYHVKFNEEIWQDIVTDVNKFIDDNPNDKYTEGYVEKIVDNLMLSGAWIQDRLNGKTGCPGLRNYRGSLSKKVRKAIGYTM